MTYHHSTSRIACGSSKHSVSLLCAHAAMFVLCVGSAFGQSYTLIDTDLARTTVHDPVFAEAELRFTDGPDDAGQTGDTEESRSMPLSRVLALLSQEPVRRPPPNISIGEEPIGRVRTVDGRVLFGRAVDSTESETLVWETLLFDRLALPLEEVREVVGDISLPFGSTLPSNPLDDAIELRNGDELTGFIGSLRPLVELETSTGVRTFEPSLVRRVVLANPTKRSENPLLALADGSVLGFDRLNSDEHGESIEVVMPQVPGGLSVDIDDLVGVVFDPETLIGLASLGRPEIQPGVGLVWIDAPSKPGTNATGGEVAGAISDPLGFADLAFAGPTVAKWPLPAGAVRFAAGVSLPEDTAPWGACEVVVSLRSGTRMVEIASVVLNAQAPRAELDAPFQRGLADLFAGDTAGLGADADVHLVIEVREGAYGPVQDRPVLHTPALLVRSRQ
jgi:hypothetical protein